MLAPNLPRRCRQTANRTGCKTSMTEGKRLEEDLPSQWLPKTGKGSNTYLRQSRLQAYIDQTR
jgi:hypothetical protein